MPDALTAVGAIAAGALICGSLLITAHDRPGIRASRWLVRMGVEFGRAMHVDAVRRLLAREVKRAGWNETPERLVAMACAVLLCLGVLGAAVSPVVAILGFFAGCVTFVVALKAGVDRRRRRFSAELVPLLDLFT
jgi:Flp pilus assembly protein TadB